MCLRKFCRFIGRYLYPLGFLSIICNTVLFFPGWTTKYALGHRLTPEVMYMGGLIGGVMVLILAFYINFKCCAKCFKKAMTMITAVIGVAGSIYSFKVAFDGLLNGPYCRTVSGWDRPYKNISLCYLLSVDQWDKCLEPKNVVGLNACAFLLLLLASSLEIIFCSIHFIIVVSSYICKAVFKRVTTSAVHMAATGIPL